MTRPQILALSGIASAGLLLAWLLLGPALETDLRSDVDAARPALSRGTERNVRAEPLSAPAVPEGVEIPVASDVEEEDFEAEIFGRCTDLEDGGPIPGVSVVVSGDDGSRASRTTDDGGAFRLTFRGPPDATAVAQPKRGWVPAGPPLELSGEQRRGEEEVLLHLRRGPSWAARGWVLDAETGEGVHRVRLELAFEDGGLSDSVVTGEDGGFLSQTAFPQGRLRAEVWDDAPDGAVRLGTFTRRHLGEGTPSRPWSIEVGIGPTFLLVRDDAGVFVAGEWTAQLVEADPEGRFAAVIDLEKGLIVPRVHPPHPWSKVPVRPGNPAWVRYATGQGSPDGALAPKLVVTSDDGGSLGEVELESIEGRHPGVLVVPLRAVATLTGRILDRDGDPIRGLGIGLHPGNALESPDDAVLLHQAQTDRDGRFLFERLEPGRYVLAADPARYPQAVRVVTVRRGGNGIDPILLASSPQVGRVSGTLEAQGGDRAGTPRLRLRSLDGLRHERVWVGGPRATEFVFEDVPRGRYELSVELLTSRARTPNAGWTPRKLAVYPPDTGLLFTSERLGRKVELGFEITSRATGERPPGTGVYFGPPRRRPDTGIGTGRRFRMPEGLPLSWTVVAPGHQPAYGDERDFRGEGRRRTAKIVLDPGWGTTLILREFERSGGRIRSAGGWGMLVSSTGTVSDRPVQPAKIYADGRFVARCDARGRAVIRLPGTPERIEIEAEGWKGVRLQPKLGRSFWHLGEYVLWMARR